MTFRVLTAALAMGLGCALAADLRAQAPQDLARRAFPVPSSVRVVRDLVYAQYGERALKVDVYRPPEPDAPGGRPGIVVVRGGGWRAGDKEAFAFIAGQLAKEGFVAASIEYRTLTEATFPAAAHDVKAAVRWLRANAVKYGVDPDAIGAIGGSAGAHLVALAGTSSVQALEGPGGNATVSSRVQAVVAMACPCNLEPISGAEALRAFIGGTGPAYAEAVTLASPGAHVAASSAPLLLLHSRTDPVVPFAQSTDIETLYHRSKAPVVLKEIAAPNVHAFWNDARYFPETLDEAVRFFRKHLSK